MLAPSYSGARETQWRRAPMPTRPSFVGWAKARLRRAHHLHVARNGGHAYALPTLRSHALRADLLPAQAQILCALATFQPDGQITQNLSSPSRKNILLSFSPKSVS